MDNQQPEVQGPDGGDRAAAFVRGWSKAMSLPAPDPTMFPAGSFGEFAGLVGFEQVWDRGTLTTRERRLIILTVLACFGRDDITQLHMGSALDLGDLDADDLNEMAVTIGAYAGLPRGVAFNGLAQRLVAERQSQTDE